MDTRQSVTSGYEETRFRNSEAPRLLDLVNLVSSVFYHVNLVTSGNYLATWDRPRLSLLSYKKVEEARLPGFYRDKVSDFFVVQVDESSTRVCSGLDPLVHQTYNFTVLQF